jgi:hypothetical protein
MSVIDVVIAPNRVTRVFVDCHDAAPDSTDQWRIEQQVARSLALAQADDDEQDTLLWAA